MEAGRPQDEAEMSVEILNVAIPTQDKLVLAKPKNYTQNPIVESFRLSKVGNSDVDVVDADNFSHRKHRVRDDRLESRRVRLLTER
jgi:hypothetical protein